MRSSLWRQKAYHWVTEDGSKKEGSNRGQITQGLEETFGDDSYIQYLDCGDGFTGI